MLEPIARTRCWNPFLCWNPLLEPCRNPLSPLEQLLEHLLEAPFLRCNPCWNPPLCAFGHF